MGKAKNVPDVACLGVESEEEALAVNGAAFVNSAVAGIHGLDLKPGLKVVHVDDQVCED